MDKNIRKISCNEQLYLDMQDIMNSFSIQFIFQYEGYIDKYKLEKAVNYILNNVNDCNLKLENKVWVKNNEEVNIEKLKIEDINLLDNEIFKRKVDYKTHSVEVYLIENHEKQYILFKILHSVLDGKGALQFINNIFNYLKDNEIEKGDNSKNEQDVIDDIYVQNKNINILPKYKLNFKISKVKKYTPRWKNIEINGYHTGIIAKIAKSLLNSFQNKNVKFMIPTDIRRHLKGTNYLGNMTLPNFLKATKNEKWEAINGRLLYSLKNKEELNKKSTSYIGYQKMSKNIRLSLLKILKNTLNLIKLFANGGIISYLGRIDLNKYSTNDYKFIDFISLPLQQPLAPFSIVVVEVNGKTNIAISCYEEQIKKEKFESICNKLKNDIELSIYSNINSKKHIKINDFLSDLNQMILKSSNEICVEDNGNKYTYKDLSKNVIIAMNILKQNNINKNDSVIIYMNRSYEFLYYTLACIKLGIIFIPLDASTNTQRLNDIVQISNTKAIITNINVNRNNNAKYINVEREDVKNLNINIKEYQHNEDDIVYKIYTSGTTGKPKEIEISFKNLSNYLTWAKRTYNTVNKCVMPLFTSLSVDLTMTSILLPLITGGKIIIKRDMFNQKILNEIIADEEINIIKITPTHLSLLSDKESKRSLEILIVGGENFNQELALNVFELFNKNIRIYNEYGPTETTIGCTYHLYAPSNDINVPIGRCIDNTEIILLDSNNNLVTKENIEGEILVAGDCVSQGLINKNDKRLCLINGKVFYKTGDIGYIKNNILHCIGRIDNQIKLNGNRIELDEISSVALKLKEIKNAVSILKENKIFLFVSLESDIELENITNYLKEKLPTYMIPNQIIVIDSIPIKQNGKIDLDALSEQITSHKNNIDFAINIIFNMTEDNSFNEYSLTMLGLDSLEMLKFIQIIADKIEDESFVDFALKNISDIKIKDIKEKIKMHGGVK